MKQIRRRKKRTLNLFFFIIIIFTGILYMNSLIKLDSFWFLAKQNALSLTPYSPISITSDLDFGPTGYNFPGSGTDIDPYIITGYNITTSDPNGIYIESTTKYFKITNCYINATDYGIYLSNVASGTATIINNTCNFNGAGIYLYYSSFTTLINNTCSYNNQGLYSFTSTNIILLNNTCENNNVAFELDWSGSSHIENNTLNNNNEGISLEFSGNTVIINNTCSNNVNYAISINYENSYTIANNTCFNNSDGIWIYLADSSNLENNTCMNNTYKGININQCTNINITGNICFGNNRGIYVWDSDSCIITYNLIQENKEYGAYVGATSDNNEIYHNTFVKNNLGGSSQANDNGTNNFWYNTNTLSGNFWDDFSGIGTYSIDGDAFSEDLYPLNDPSVPIISEYNTKLNLVIVFLLLYIIVILPCKKKKK